MPSSWTIMPRNAIMEMRPCLISTARRRARPSWSSQNGPEGSIGPGSTPMSPLTTTLEAACWPGATKATAGAARRARASLAILIVCGGKKVLAHRAWVVGVSSQRASDCAARPPLFCGRSKLDMACNRRARPARTSFRA